MTVTVHEAGFAFVQGLARDLNCGDVQVPSFPDVVMRIKRTLKSEDCNADKLGRVVATEPALAARLLGMANSALMSRGAKRVNDLRTAINRLGQDMLYNAAMSVAVEQIFLGASLARHRERLKGIWRDSAQVAAYAYTIARRTTRLNADEALLAGLLHNVGKLYIVKNASEHEALFETDEILSELIEQWYGHIGSAILQGWGFSDETSAAAADHLDLDRVVHDGVPDLTDVVTVAVLMAGRAERDEINMESVRACMRMGLDDEKRLQVSQESRNDIQKLAQALNG